MMCKRLFRMTYVKGVYDIEMLSIQKSNLDINKTTNEVKKISSNQWVSTSQSNLIEFAKDHQKKAIDTLEQKLLTLKNGGIRFK